MRGTVPGLLACVLLSAACGYALAGRGISLPDHIKRIGVPNFTNQSDVPELDRILTEAVREELQSKRRYTVVQDSTGVDALVSGTIRPMSISVASQTANRQAQRYLITVSATVEFKDMRDNKVLWQNPSLRATEDIELADAATAANPAAVFGQDQIALSRLAKSFARSLVASMLEMF